MSNQTGIKASESLLEALKSFTLNGDIRSMLIKIENEALVPGEVIKVESNYFDDVALLDKHISENEPVYILYRADGSSASGISSSTTLISYIPDSAPVRHKMLYAATRNTLVREVGSDKVTSSFFTTEKSEISPNGFKKFAEHEKLSQPLTEEERALKSVRELEAVEGSSGTMTRKSHVSPNGLSFPLSKDAADALEGLSTQDHNLVVLEINIAAESIDLSMKAVIEEPTHLDSMISTDQPRYTFFVFKHQYEGGEVSPLVFIYTCPTGAKIKERMLYASCRGAIITEAETCSGLKVEKRIEASNGSEISRESLVDDLHPKKVETKLAFARPKAPGRRR
ncbi:hypothetical protein V1512DRAFT_245324 [Lipomyces arxii]|uniref:uncharacterized protein n=1 Tax=Lipomyces arxii TaxID=56418 RepID=UPI0034CF536E